MSVQQAVYSAASPGSGTFSLPLNIISPSVTVVVYGGRGGSSMGGGYGGAIVSGQILATLLPVEYVIGENANGGLGGSGYSGGGGGGGWLYGFAVAPYYGGGGGGSSAIITTGGALYIEAGGGDGLANVFGPLSPWPSLYAAGSGGGYASNTPDNGLNVGFGAASGGSQGGAGGNGTYFGGTGHGGASPTIGISSSGQESGEGVGSGGDVQLNCAASFTDSSNVTSVTYTAGSTEGLIVFSWHAADAPSAPSLDSPTIGQYLDSFGEGVTFTGTYNAPSSDTGALYNVALALQIGSGFVSYWNGTNFTTSTDLTPNLADAIWVTPTTGSGSTSNEQFTVVVPPGLIADGDTYIWTMATSESTYGLQGPFAATQTFIAVNPPVATIIGPIGDVNSLTPTVSWTATFPDSGHQLNYRFVIYSQAQDMPANNTTPPSSPSLIYDTTLVPGTSMSFSVPSDTLHSINNYYGYLQVQNSAGSVPSLWTPAPFTVQLLSSDTITITGYVTTEPTTGLPAPYLTMTTSGTDLDQAEFQSDYMGDGDWQDLICGISDVLSQTCSVYDLGCPYNVPLTYRARGVGYIGEEQYITAWSNTLQFVGVPSISWAVVAPTSPENSMLLHRLASSGATSTDETATPTTPAMPGSLVASFIEDEWEQLGTFHPFGTSTATVVHGDIWEPTFTLDLLFMSSAEWATFRGIRQLQQVVLLKSDMEGTLYWVTLGPDLNPGIVSEADRHVNPNRGLTVQCTPTYPYVPPNPFIPTN